MNSITMQLQADKLIRMALEEDITSEDVSTNAVMPTKVQGTVDLIAKEDGVIAGMDVYARVFKLLDEDTEIEMFCHDGDEVREGDADGKISLNQQKPSKHAGLRRFGPEKFLQRNNEFMKERPIFYKKPIKTEKDFSTWLRCFYYTTKAVITEYIYF